MSAEHTSPKLTTLYDFTGFSDGGNPSGLVIGDGGVLYGGTSSGGAFGLGTIFTLTPPPSPGGPWTEAVLYSFTGLSGANPSTPVFGSGGVLYGTTVAGGDSNLGTVFSLTPPATPGGNWTEVVVHSFSGGTNDGTYPTGIAIGGDGALYGTTGSGGSGSCTLVGSGCGTVFSLRPPASPGGKWKEKILYNFMGDTDGSTPTVAVIGRSGVVYGTTVYGGGNACFNGCGTVFELTPPLEAGEAWTETLLYNFTGGTNDGFLPGGVVIGKGGVLFGTTYSGGSGPCAETLPPSCGTVFSVTPPASPGGAWTEAVLYNFTGGSAAAYPMASLAVGGVGVLYGTTLAGGTGHDGTVFSLSPPASPGGPWTETVLHSFIGSTGSNASSVVIGSGGVLFGATSFGGTSNAGTIYMLKP